MKALRSLFVALIGSLIFFNVATPAYSQALLSAPATSATLIQSITTTGSQTSVDFQNIPGGYNHLVILGNARSQAAVSQDTIFVRFNNDSGANYDQSQVSSTNNSNPTGGGATAQTQIAMVIVPGASAASGYAAAVSITIPDYSGTSFNKSAFATSGGRNNATTPPLWSSAGGDWASTAAVTRVTLILNAAAAFANGLTFSLYGYP